MSKILCCDTRGACILHIFFVENDPQPDPTSHTGLIVLCVCKDFFFHLADEWKRE